MVKERSLEQLTGWVNKRLGYGERCKRAKLVDQRQTTSRIVEDALSIYLPMLEKRLGIDLTKPVRRGRA